MIKSLLLILILLPLNSFAEESLSIRRVVDADTLIVYTPFMPAPLKQETPLRLSNIDAPNVKRWANCDKEAALGKKAKEYVEYLLNRAETVQVKIVGRDKYGRLLGQVFVNKKSLSDYLIEANFAVPYYGGKKQSWCH